MILASCEKPEMKEEAPSFPFLARLLWGNKKSQAFPILDDKVNFEV